MTIPNSKDNCLIGHHPHGEHSEIGDRGADLSRLRIAFMIGLGFIALEVFGAWISGSLALLADAMHMLADSVALGFGLIAGYLAMRPGSERRSFGYYRLEVISAFMNGLLLLGMAVFLMFEAYERWTTPGSVKALPMLITASIGFAANLVMLFLIHPTKEHGLNFRGVFLHVLGDTLSSVAVIVGAVVLYFTNSVFPDLAASLFVALMIIVMATKLIWDAVHILMEGTPRHINPEEIKARLISEFRAIQGIHDLHIWEISSKLFAFTAHIEAELASLGESRELVENVDALLSKEYKIAHSTIQIEPWTSDKSSSS